MHVGVGAVFLPPLFRGLRRSGNLEREHPAQGDSGVRDGIGTTGVVQFRMDSSRLPWPSADRSMCSCRRLCGEEGNVGGGGPCK